MIQHFDSRWTRYRVRIKAGDSGWSDWYVWGETDAQKFAKQAIGYAQDDDPKDAIVDAASWIRINGGFVFPILHNAVENGSRLTGYEIEKAEPEVFQPFSA